MARIVQKFGGTSVADIARLEKVALLVKRAVDAGHQVAVVVSAMAGVTNQLVGYVRSIAGACESPEHDAVVASGEQITSGLLACALTQIGVPARSFLGWQIPILTDDHHTNAHILDVSPDVLEGCFFEGVVPVIAGFQGISKSGRLTTLGRGGSDTTAVAIAAALKADWCDIYTDVEGVYSADPRIVPKARKLQTITYHQMYELASHGAKVLQKRSVETAMRFGVKVRVLSSFCDTTKHDAGTTVVHGDDQTSRHVNSITHTLADAKITLRDVQIEDASFPEIAQGLRHQCLGIEAVMTDVRPDGQVDLAFSISKGEIPQAIAVAQSLQSLLNYKDLGVDSNVARVSLIGANLSDHPTLVNHLFKTLEEHKIVAQIVAHADHKISLFVPEGAAETSVRVLHSACGLDVE